MLILMTQRTGRVIISQEHKIQYYSRNVLRFICFEIYIVGAYACQNSTRTVLLVHGIVKSISSLLF